MKNLSSNIREKLVSKYLVKDSKFPQKSTNINILLNRVKIQTKKENRKKIYFSAAASTGLILFGLIIF